MQVLFEDNHCLAVVKPAGFATQAPPGIASLESLAKAIGSPSNFASAR
jgi:23S rRNA-/tRNA-specific pseudouridylate synthase